MFLLDTNVISKLRKAGDGKADAQVTGWVAAQDAGGLFISAITMMGLEIGVRRIGRRDPRQGGMLRSWLSGHVLPEFEGRVLPVDTAVALRCAALHVPDPRSDRDALIAATALVHGFSVVARNNDDFRGIGVALVNPWEPV